MASQALISGAFSLTRQAVQLGYLPRLEIDHTSTREIGQIYIPTVNWALMIGCIALVLGFRTSSNLAAAYGVAVTTTMVVTVLLLAVVARERRGWSLGAVAAFGGVFLVIDLIVALSYPERFVVERTSSGGATTFIQDPFMVGCSERSDVNIPALQLLINLGYQYLTPDAALDLRGDVAPLGRALEEILRVRHQVLVDWGVVADEHRRRPRAGRLCRLPQPLRGRDPSHDPRRPMLICSE